MNVLITGGAGRLGLELVKKCLEEKASVKVLDLSYANWDLLEKLGVEIIKGDIRDKGFLNKACKNIETVIHLAALLPPKTESSRELAMSINLEGTRNIINSLDSNARLIFSSSISVYGLTAYEFPPIKEEHSRVAHNNYSESKILSENIIKKKCNKYTILRIAPISVADLLELPDTVAYRADQRVEFVFVEDAAIAIYSCLSERDNEIYNIGGGGSWQMKGEEYLKRYYGALGIDVEPNYPDRYTAVDWYDTTKSQHLGYQKTSFNKFEKMLIEVGKELGLI